MAFLPELFCLLLLCVSVLLVTDEYCVALNLPLRCTTWHDSQYFIYQSHSCLKQYLELYQRWGVVLQSEFPFSYWDLYIFKEVLTSVSYFPRVRSPTKSASYSLKWTSEEKELFEQGLVSLFIYVIFWIEVISSS